MSFTDKVVLVTGASRGIGRATAQAFADRGATVAVHYHRNRRAAEETLASLRSGPHRLFQTDLGSIHGPQDLATAVIKEMGTVDVLVNNAGIYKPHPLDEASYEEWQELWDLTLATNLTGPVNLIYCIARRMILRGGGRIINITSRGAFRGEPEAPAYGAAKAGLNAASQSLAKALAPHGVFVYAVAPGWVETDMAKKYLHGPEGDAIRAQSPLNRVARPEEVAATVVFLAGENTEFLTGGIVDVNGASYLRS